MIVISDTTTISSLFLIDKLWVLKELYPQIAIPKAVFEELEKLEQIGRQIEIIRSSDWIQVLMVSNKDLVRILSLVLDDGEAEAIALAKETNADLLIIDEIKGRSYAKELNINIIGLVGILLLAKEKKVIENVGEVLTELQEKAGFWISKNLWETALKAASEK